MTVSMSTCYKLHYEHIAIPIMDLIKIMNTSTIFPMSQARKLEIIIKHFQALSEYTCPVYLIQPSKIWENLLSKNFMGVKWLQN